MVDSKHEHSSRSSLEAQVYRSLGLTLGGGMREDMTEQYLGRNFKVEGEGLARKPGQNVGYNEHQRDFCEREKWCK